MNTLYTQQFLRTRTFICKKIVSPCIYIYRLIFFLQPILNIIWALHRVLHWKYLLKEINVTISTTNYVCKFILGFFQIKHKPTAIKICVVLLTCVCIIYSENTFSSMTYVNQIFEFFALNRPLSLIKNLTMKVKFIKAPTHYFCLAFAIMLSAIDLEPG